MAEEMKNTVLAGCLAILTLLLTGVIDGYLLARGLPSGADSVLVGTIVGAWNAATGIVLSYFFGSSASHDKQSAAADSMASTITPKVTP
ncbi:hypothetical protein [Rhodanobacter sp. B04]|uniref:hypothetical protein n=1 Tax=Rhodanobacter sp. B04 TaxID=1945860 RepID=UPI001115965B|nr:hypothetical protein [Rhodanobacter sp. B04]